MLLKEVEDCAAMEVLIDDDVSISGSVDDFVSKVKSIFLSSLSVSNVFSKNEVVDEKS